MTCTTIILEVIIAILGWFGVVGAYDIYDVSSLWYKLSREVSIVLCLEPSPEQGLDNPQGKFLSGTWPGGRNLPKINLFWLISIHLKWLLRLDKIFIINSQKIQSMVAYMLVFLMKKETNSSGFGVQRK